MKTKIKNNERLIKPSDLPDVTALLTFISELDKKYGIDSTQGEGFGHLALERPFISYLYESNIYYIMFGNSSDITNLPKYQNTICPVNVLLSAETRQPQKPLVMEDADKEKLIFLREQAQAAIKAAYPKTPKFEKTDTNISDYDKRLQEQGFKDGSKSYHISFPIYKNNCFEVDYSRTSTNKSPDFSTTYQGWQNQEYMPHTSLAYAFYKKWNAFHGVALTVEEFAEMWEDVKELADKYSVKLVDGSNRL